VSRGSKAQELENDIRRLASECKLDSWTMFVDEMKVPGDIYPALATGRPELIKLIQPRELAADEAKVLFDIIGTLINTNMALREHASQVAHFMDTWADAFKHLHSVGDKVQRFANFRHDDVEDE
jgi:hypothetical protein